MDGQGGTGGLEVGTASDMFDLQMFAGSVLQLSGAPRALRTNPDFDSVKPQVNKPGGMMYVIRRMGSTIVAVLGVAACTPGTSVETAPSTQATTVPAPVVMEMPASEVTDMEIRATQGLTWTDLVVPGFPSGGKMAVLHGNPGAKGDYTLRLQFPDGYEFPLHWHPGGEHLTVLTGSFHLGMQGETAARDYAPGDFLYIPGRMAHFGGARGMTVIQLHGEGPFAINLGSAK